MKETVHAKEDFNFLFEILFCVAHDWLRTLQLRAINKLEMQIIARKAEITGASVGFRRRRR